MLQRLLDVTSGYLKFTFACMLAGTAIFFFAGLAMAEPRVFLLVVALLASAYFVVRMEIKSYRLSRVSRSQRLSSTRASILLLVTGLLKRR